MDKYIKLVVKGKRAEVEAHAVAHKVDFTLERETAFRECIGRAPVSQLEHVISWYNSTGTHYEGTPQPAGTLLFYSQVQKL